MSKIKWISQEIDARKVQDLINRFSDYLIPESLQITSSGIYEDMTFIQVTFMLSQTFNNMNELDKALETEPLF